MALKTGMELLYELFWATCTAIILFVVLPMIIKVLSNASCGDNKVQQNQSKSISGIHNGEKRSRRSIEGKFDGRLEVKASKSKKKKVKFADDGTAKIVEFQVEEENTNSSAKNKEFVSQSVEFVDEKVRFLEVSEGSNVNVVDFPEEGNLIEEVLVKKLQRNRDQEVDTGAKGLIEEVDEGLIEEVDDELKGSIEEVDGSVSTEQKDSEVGGFDKETDESDKTIEQTRENVGFNEADSGVYLFGVRIGKSENTRIGPRKIGEGKPGDRLEDKVIEPEKVELFEETERRQRHEYGEVAKELAANESVRDQQEESEIAGSGDTEDKRNQVGFVTDETERQKTWTGDQGIRLISEKVIDDQSKEVRDATSDAKSSNVNERKHTVENNDQEEGVLSDEDEWEGIERSELEKDFAKATNFVECGDKEGRLAKLGNDVIKQLHGLQKVAMEGPCNEPQPMALKLAARAKWNVWQKLGNMSQEDAMEQYIKLLSDNISGWGRDISGVEAGGKSTAEVNPSNSVTGSSKAAMN